MKLGRSSSSYRAAFAQGRMDLREWLRVCAEDLELDGVELLDAHFATTDTPYLLEIKKLCTDLQLTVSGIAVISDLGPDDRRARESEKVKYWCDIAPTIGAPVVRVFAGWIPVKRSEPQVGRLIGAFRKVFGAPPPNARRIWSDVTCSASAPTTLPRMERFWVSRTSAAALPARRCNSLNSSTTWAQRG